MLSPIVAVCLSQFLSVPWSSYMSLTVSSSSIGLLHASHCLLLLLAVSHYYSGPIELLHVSHNLLCLLAVSHCIHQYHGVPPCLSLSLPVSWSYCMPLTVSYTCWQSLTISPLPYSYYMSLTVSYYCWLSLTLFHSAMELLHSSYCLPCRLAIFHCLSNPIEILHLSHYLS